MKLFDWFLVIILFGSTAVLGFDSFKTTEKVENKAGLGKLVSYPCSIQVHCWDYNGCSVWIQGTQNLCESGWDPCFPSGGICAPNPMADPSFVCIWECVVLIF